MLIPANESSVLTLRPSWLMVLPRLVPAAIVAAIVLLAFRYFQTPRGGVWMLAWYQWVVFALVLVGMALVIMWLPVQYAMTNVRAISRTGWFSRVTRDVPLASVQHVVMQQSVWESFTGTGTILFATAGTDGYALAWQSVRHPQHVLSRVRMALDAARGPSPHVQQNVNPSLTQPRVIGLVGGIGAGKSAVARALERCNYLVIDADKDAKAALDRPDVRGHLISWWGDAIVSSDGKVDRKKLAEIIFSDPAQRRRLEALVHPIVRADRQQVIAQAKREGKAGVVIDAPLLFEAGSDKECDVVWFVDAPLDQRLARVRSRGWSDEELTRREAAQLSLDEKRNRSGVVIVNDADLATLEIRVAEALAM
jgi:dephospho-CoA kinase